MAFAFLGNVAQGIVGQFLLIQCKGAGVALLVQLSDQRTIDQPEPTPRLRKPPSEKICMLAYRQSSSRTVVEAATTTTATCEDMSKRCRNLFTLQGSLQLHKFKALLHVIGL